MVTVPDRPRVRVERRSHGKKRLARKACVFNFSPLTRADVETFREEHPFVATFRTTVVVANRHGAVTLNWHRTPKFSQCEQMTQRKSETIDRALGCNVLFGWYSIYHSPSTASLAIFQYSTASSTIFQYSSTNSGLNRSMYRNWPQIAGRIGRNSRRLFRI